MFHLLSPNKKLLSKFSNIEYSNKDFFQPALLQMSFINVNHQINLLGKLMNVLGRKRSCILVSLISCGGWILLATSNHLVMICIARFIGGWVAACDGLICESANLHKIKTKFNKLHQSFNISICKFNFT